MVNDSSVSGKRPGVLVRRPWRQRAVLSPSCEDEPRCRLPDVPNSGRYSARELCHEPLRRSGRRIRLVYFEPAGTTRPAAKLAQVRASDWDGVRSARRAGRHWLLRERRGHGGEGMGRAGLTECPARSSYARGRLCSDLLLTRPFLPTCCVGVWCRSSHIPPHHRAVVQNQRQPRDIPGPKEGPWHD